MAVRDKTGEFIFNPIKRSASVAVGIGYILSGAALILAGVEVSDGVWGDDIYTAFQEHNLTEGEEPRDPALAAIALGSFGTAATAVGIAIITFSRSRYKAPTF